MSHLAPEFPGSYLANQTRETLVLQLRKRTNPKLENKNLNIIKYENGSLAFHRQKLHKTLAMRFESYGPFCSCLACLQISLFHFITTWKLSEIDPVSDGQVRPIVLCNPWGVHKPSRFRGIYISLFNVSFLALSSQPLIMMTITKNGHVKDLGFVFWWLEP